jgi:hypothetical protein
MEHRTLFVLCSQYVLFVPVKSREILPLVVQLEFVSGSFLPKKQ